MSVKTITPSFDPATYTKESREAWNKASRYYDEKIASRFFDGLTKITVRWADIRQGERVLDVACGAGIATLEAASFIGGNGVVTGIDLAPTMIELAWEKAKAAGLSRVEFKEM